MLLVTFYSVANYSNQDNEILLIFELRYDQTNNNEKQRENKCNEINLQNVGDLQHIVFPQSLSFISHKDFLQHTKKKTISIKSICFFLEWNKS